MWLEFFRFDLRYQLRQPLLWIITVALVSISFMTAGSDTVRIGGAIGNLYLNAPIVIARFLAILSFISMFLVTVFIAGAVLRDNEVGIADMIFATPMKKRDYLVGRFLAGFSVCMLIFLLIAFALVLGSHMPSVDPVRLGVFSWRPYVWSFLVFVVPNLLFVAALLMLLAATTRSMLLVYVGVMGFFVLWSVAGLLIKDMRIEWIAVMLDPFGIRALSSATRYFSVLESNTMLPGLSGLLLVNRLTWSAIALILFAATLTFFKPQRIGTGRKIFGKAKQVVATVSKNKNINFNPITPKFSGSTAWAQCWSLLRFDAKSVLKSVPFLVLLLMALLNFAANMVIGGQRFDSAPYPLTRLMLEDLDGGFNFILSIVLIYYAGELVFKERQAKIGDVTDTMPMPNWAPLVSKCFALVAVILVFMVTGVVAAILVQIVKGGAPIEFGLYAEGVLLSSLRFILIGLCALALQVLANNKFIGYFLTILLLYSNDIMKSMSFDSRLVNFASLPALEYSDMNGYGHFLVGWGWFALYWSLFLMVVLIVAQAFAVRGLSQGWRIRLRLGTRNLRNRSGLVLAVSLLAFVLTGGWIYFNTNVLNHYQSERAKLADQATYEKLYRQYFNLPHPKITDIHANVDIYPAERRVAIHGHYVLQNKTSQQLDTLRIQSDPNVETIWTNLPAHQTTLDDKKFGFSIIKLNQPLMPGATIALDFDVNVINRGFTNSGKPDHINLNGTYFTDRDFFPKFGYDEWAELEDKNARRALGLGAWNQRPLPSDQAARDRSFYNIESDWINFDTVVSTSADQTAIAPGDLVKTWEAGGRRYFHYQMDRPMVPFIAYLSANWEVKKSQWNGVPIEVYYDRKHPYNVDNMISGVQHALAYYTEQFGPYPHNIVRIVEFPRYWSDARSFPNTIPFSESLGFINDLRDKDDVDHVFYVTAHEVAHQWWGEQVIAADVQGSGMVMETLAEYSALMVTEKQFGPEKLRHILRFDLDDYLAGRQKEMDDELPLINAVNQVFVQYRKGSLIFYRLRNEIGEAALNRAVRNFLLQFRDKSAPYATSLQLVAAIRAETAQDKQALITDMFDNIVLYDNRVIDASAKQRLDGLWDVTMKLHLAKIQVDSKGKETKRDYDEPVELAVFAAGTSGKDKDKRVLFDEQRKLGAGDSTVTITVKEKPFEVGVDPYNLLIDRNSKDKRKQVSF